MQNIFWFYGDNELSRNNKVQSWKKAFIQKNGNNADIEVKNAKEIRDFDDFFRILKTPSLFAEKRLIFIENYADEKKYDKSHLNYFEEICSDNILIFIDKKLPRLPKALPENLKLEEFKTSTNELNKLIDGICNQRNKKIDFNLKNFLSENYKENTLLLLSEVKKLCNIDSTQITMQDYEKLCQKPQNLQAFAIVDLYCKNKKAELINTLNKIVQQRQDIYSLWHLIVWQISLLYKIKLNCTGNEKPFVIQKNQSLANSIELPKLKKILSNICQIDHKIKYGLISGENQIKHEIIRSLYT